MASALLLALALAEETKPEVPKNELLSSSVLVHSTLEIVALTIFVLGMMAKIKWQGPKHFFTHMRSLCKFIVWCIALVEVIVVLIRNKNHIRVTRALRPLFLIDNIYMRETRRVLRQIVLSLPPILYMLLLLMFFILIFAMLGFYLFSPIPDDEYFQSFQRSLISLFVLLTSANYPDVMMASYHRSGWSVLYFVAYIGFALYFLMSLLLGVVCEAFTSIEKMKFKDRFLHKRCAAKHAFNKLCNRDTPNWISQRQFMRLMTFLKPKKVYSIEALLKLVGLDVNGIILVAFNSWYLLNFFD